MFPIPWKAGHFYSPIPEEKDVQRAVKAKSTFNLPKSLDLDANLLYDRTNRFLVSDSERLVDYLHKEGKIYPTNSTQFVLADAIFLWCFLSSVKPRRIIEIGSGHSTALMLDAKDYLKLDVQITCVEPFPTRLRETLGPRIVDVDLMESNVQDVDSNVFSTLKADDLLFIDSSHVSKAGSDVNYLFFEVVPSLRPGCFVHVHDIFMGFEYPEKWFREGRSWNEAYLLRAFLMFNSTFSIYAWPQVLSRPSGYDEIASKSGIKFGYPGSSLYFWRNL